MSNNHPDTDICDDLKGIYPFEKVRPIVTEILKTVIQDGKGLELNTSYRRYGLMDTTPSVEILKLYRELGGEIVTMGSDAHAAEYVGGFMDEARDVLRDCGFRYFTVFRGRKAGFVALD